MVKSAFPHEWLNWNLNTILYLSCTVRKKTCILTSKFLEKNKFEFFIRFETISSVSGKNKMVFKMLRNCNKFCNFPYKGYYIFDLFDAKRDLIRSNILRLMNV